MSDILTMRRKTLSSPLGGDPSAVVQTNSAVTVTNVATSLPAVSATGRGVIIIVNNGAQTVYLGDLAVSIANGIPLEPGASFIADAGSTLQFYGIVAAGNADVRVMELG